jgi:predicted PurR-regulated permease PerM
MMQTKIIERYFFFGLLLATLFFTSLIFRPFWAVLTLGISFSILLHPLYEWFKKAKMPNWLSSLLTVVLFTILLCGPILAIGLLVFNQSQDVYHSIIENNKAEMFLNKVDENVNKILPQGITLDSKQKADEVISLVTNNITKIFQTTISAFLSFLLMLLTIFFFLKDGSGWRKALVILSPLADEDDEKIISKLAIAVNGVIKGYLFIALIQGLCLGVGLWIFGIPNPALWGVVAAFASLVPTIGTALVSVPAVIFLFATGSTGNAIGLLIWAVALVSTIDNFLSPFIVGKKINIPSLFILFSVLGGISLVGPIGILVGPLTLSFLYSLISIYRHEFNESIVV